MLLLLLEDEYYHKFEQDFEDWRTFLMGSEQIVSLWPEGSIHLGTAYTDKAA